MSKDITFCLTSCNRFDLLQITLDSFFELNKYPIKRYLVIEDSGLPEMRDKILSKYGDRIELIFNETNLGPFKPIDKMYSMVDTEYIFHSEDDWKYEGPANFIEQSLDILEERKDIHQVWMRKGIELSWIEKQSHLTKNKTEYRMVKNPHLDVWCGYSFNPGLRRKSDYDRMFPNGCSEFIVPGEFAGLTELKCNLHAAKQGYRAASLLKGSCVHIGDGRTTLK